MMNIKTGFEILSDLLGRGYYSIIYVEQNFPLPFQPKGVNKLLNVEQSQEILISSAVAGNNTLGIYRSPISPRSNVELRGVSIFITTELPIDPQVPVIFCRNIDTLIERFNLAIKVSEDFKTPVIFCVNGNTLNNFAEIDNIEHSVERVSPYISKETLKRLDTNHTAKYYQKIFDFLISQFKNLYSGEGELSFKDSNSRFLNFYVPIVMQLALNSDIIEVDEKDYHFWESITKYDYSGLKISRITRETTRSLKNFFCPGCPILMISKNISFDNKILITDINCPTIRRYFGFTLNRLENVIGMTISKPSSGILFVGNLSNLNQNLVGYMKNFEFILLNNGLKSSFGLPTISKPYKFKDINCVFPYGCENIPRYSPLKVNIKKCICIRKKEELHCVKGSNCPALFENNGTIAINENICVGCKLCELSCPYGAIK